MNEDKYIDRDKILAYLSEVKETCLSNFEYDTSDTISNIILEIENGEIPVSNVAHVKHGRWIRFFDSEACHTHMRCSVCSAYWSDPSHADHFRYCPNCGTKMDGDDGDE